MFPVFASRLAAAGAALLVLCLVPPTAAGHGGVVEEDDLCVINIGYLKAHFKIYVPRQTRHDEYCEDIPVRGESVFVMEYLHEGLNEAEVDFRIIRNVTGKGVFARLDDVDAIEDLDAVTVRYQEPTVVPDVFTLLHAFDSDGEYIGIVSARQPDTGKLYTAVFPFEVGYTGLGYWPWIVAAVVLLQLQFWFMSRRRKRNTAAPAVALAVLAALPGSGIADDATTYVSDAGHFRVGFVSELDPLAINRIHAWTLTITDADGNAVTAAAVDFDGGMPEHDHGLPTAPRLAEHFDDGRYRIEGIRFHMRGYWELRITIEDGTHRDTVTIPLTIR